MDNFKDMQEYVQKMKATSSTLDKTAILSEYKDNAFVKKCVLYTLDPYRMYGVTSKQVRAMITKGKTANIIVPYPTLFELLDGLANRDVTGHNAIHYIINFINNSHENTSLILDILDKDIKTRANATLVNKVWGKGFIPVFDAALANKYEPKLVNFHDGWYASRKLDGLRCICKIDSKGNARFYSRKGKEFFTLDALAKSVQDSELTSTVLDGELCIMNGELEDFTAISKEYNKKGHTIKNPKFFIFDVLTYYEFNRGHSPVRLMDRINTLMTIPEGFTVLEQRHVKSDGEITVQLDQAVRQGQEGLILRRNCAYKGKRSNDILKVKSFQDAEYLVIGTAFGKMRFIEDGRDIERETLSAVLIEHKGVGVTVGYGFSKAEREYYYRNPQKIVGKTITVKYFGESKDSTGKVSLRFPTLKAIHGTERQV